MISDDPRLLALWIYATFLRPDLADQALLSNRPPLVWLRGHGRRYLIRWSRHNGSWYGLLQHLRPAVPPRIQVAETWHAAEQIERIVGEQYAHVRRI